MINRLLEIGLTKHLLQSRPANRKDFVVQDGDSLKWRDLTLFVLGGKLTVMAARVDGRQAHCRVKERDSVNLTGDRHIAALRKEIALIAYRWR